MICKLLKKLPEEVDRMSARDMDEMLVMENELQKMRADDMERSKRRG